VVEKVPTPSLQAPHGQAHLLGATSLPSIPEDSGRSYELCSREAEILVAAAARVLPDITLVRRGGLPVEICRGWLVKLTDNHDSTYRGWPESMLNFLPTAGAYQDGIMNKQVAKAAVALVLEVRFLSITPV
jgi:hypothetical protein